MGAEPLPFVGPDDPLTSLIAENRRLRRRLEREIKIRRQAEMIAEQGLSDLYQRQRELEFLARITMMANEGASTDAVLPVALEFMCEFIGWSAAHAHFVGRGPTARIFPSNIWYCDAALDLSAFQRATANRIFAPGESLPGEVLAAGRSVWISDIRSYTNFPRQQAALESGIRAGFGVPMLIGQDVVGVLEFFGTQPMPADEALLRMVEQAGTQLGRVFERHRADRVSAELRSAAAYVASILPGELRGPVHVSSRYLPSQELAGDSFDYRWIDDDHLIVYLIDVSGHGIGPALLSVSAHNVLRSGSMSLATLLSPEAVLAELNRLFQMERHGGNYLTMWYGVYELSSRTLRFASAGAPPAIVISPDAAGVAIELSTDGKPLGMFDDTVYTSDSVTVTPGCRILICSDGAYEDARIDGRRLLWTDFRDLFSRKAGASIDELVETLQRLTPDGTFDDDCSLIQLEFPE